MFKARNATEANRQADAVRLALLGVLARQEGATLPHGSDMIRTPFRQSDRRKEIPGSGESSDSGVPQVCPPGSKASGPLSRARFRATSPVSARARGRRRTPRRRISPGRSLTLALILERPPHSEVLCFERQELVDELLAREGPHGKVILGRADGLLLAHP